MTGTSDRGRHRLAVMSRHASARKTSQRGLQFNTISRLILFFYHNYSNYDSQSGVFVTFRPCEIDW